MFAAGIVSGARASWPAAEFIALALIWGASFLFIKVGVDVLAPFEVTWLRIVMGASALVVLMVVRNDPWPRGRVIWTHLAVISVLFCVVPFTLFGWAEQSISSGLASILNATTPLMAVVFATAVLPSEVLSRATLTGLAVGVTGVLVVVGPGVQGTGGSPWGAVACLGATACYGLAFAYQRRFVTPYGLTGLPVAAGMVLMGAVIMLVSSPWAAPAASGVSWSLAGSMAALGVLGTGIAYLLNTRIINAWGATNASAVTYLIPVVGVALGVLVLDEPFRLHQVIGGIVVVAGILIAHGRLRVPAVGGRATP